MSDWADQLGQPTGTPEPSGDDWADSLTTTKSNEARTLDANLMVPITPDRSAKVLDLHKRTGLPINLVDSQLETVEQEAKKTDFDTEKFTKENPIVSKWMSENPQQASLGYDDHENLSSLEKFFRIASPAYGVFKSFTEDRPGEDTASDVVKKSTKQAGYMYLQSHGGMEQQIATIKEGRTFPITPEYAVEHAKKMGLIGKDVVVDVSQGLLDQPEILDAVMKAADDLERRDVERIQKTELYQKGAERFEFGQASIEELQPRVRPGSAKYYLGASTQAFFGSVLPMMGVSLATGGTAMPGLATMGTQVYGQRFGESLKEGRTIDQAKADAWFYSLAETIPEQIPLGIALKRGTPYFKKLFQASWTEATQEMFTEVLQAGYDAGVLDENMSLGDALRRVVDAGIIGALMGGSMATVAHAAQKPGDMIEKNRLKRQAKDQENFFTALGENATESKIREQLPDKYRELVDTLTKDGPVENVYTPIEFFQSKFEQAGVNPRQMAIDLGIVKQYDEAVEHGGKLAIPTSVYATKIAPTEFNADFSKELTITPDGLTSREMGDLQTEFEQAKAKEPDIFEQSVQKVREDVQKQLEAIMPSDVAEPQAALWEARYRARAERLGVDPWTLYKQRPISFTSEIDGKLVTVETIPSQQTEVPRGTKKISATETEKGDISKSNVLVRESNAKAWTEILPRMPLSLYEKLAQISPDDATSEEKGQLQELRQRISETGQTPEAAMREMWGPELADAPRRLRQAFTGELVVSEVPSGATQFILNQQGMAPAQRMAGDLAKGPALTLTPNTVPGEGPYRVTHWLDGQPVRHEAFPDTTAAQKAFDKALTETNDTAEKMGEKAIAEQRMLFQQAKDQTETNEFKRWFGDSKVVDENGKPLVVYHGTKSAVDFTEFAPDSHFGETPEAANVIATNMGLGRSPSRVIPVFLSIKNPKRVNDQANKGWGLWDDVIEQAKSEGYDGIVYENKAEGYGKDSWIAFRPEQIKSAIGNRGTFDPNEPNILYQSAAPQPQLSVLHNLSSENLEFADKIGGLAVPSLAVVKEGMGLEGYGDVTLIGRKELADPKQTEVFDADAYTSTFPRPEYRKVKSKVAQKFVDALRPWTNAFEEAGVFSEAWDNAVNRPKPWDTISSFERSKAAKAWFLSEQGINVKPVRQHAERRYRWADDKEFREVFHPLFSDIWAETSKVDRGEALMRIGDAARKAIDKYLAGDSREAKAYGQIYTESNEARQVLASSFGIDGSWLTDGESMPLTIADRISDDLKREGQMVVNRSATDKKINKALVGKEADFKQWVEDKILPMYGDPFLTLGRKKVEYNLENIVTYMTRGGVHAQEETMTFGEGKARAVAATRITSFQEMRNRAEWQITERENVDEIREKAKKAMSEWRDKVVDYYGEKSSRDFGRVWEGLDASMRAISKWAKGRGFAEALRSEGFKSVPDYVIEQGKEAGNLFMQAPVPYFEAKPERAVKLEEFAGAVIPEDSSDKVKAILAKHKIPFKTYPVRFDEVARTAVVNQFRNELTEKGENVLFQKERGVTRFTDRTVNIELFKNADLSTLLHESSHVFLLEMHDDVQYLRSQEKLSAKQQGIIDDFNNLLKWFGITEQELLEQTTVDGKTTLSPKSVKANEQFARGMEAYLAEGKAPSSELRSAFQRFKAWLTHVYRLWKNDPKVALNVHLNDEVRGIMDRLLATDEQIRQAQAESEIKAVFTDATMAGMSDTEFIAYQKTLEDANEESKQNLEQQLMREFQRERTKWWKEERAKIRAEIEADVDQRPIYRALAELKREGGPRLDRKAITERFKDRVKQLPTGVAVKEGGIDPDTAAEMLGFKSGEDLINQLSTMQNRNKLIDAETDQRMVQEHGNMLLDGSIFEKAREAVRDEKRSEIILRELKALQKKAREVKPFVEAAKKEGEEQKKAGKQIYLAAIPTVAQARETAQRTIAGTRIRDLRPMQYFAAARKASKSAIEAVNKGDFVLAAVLKRQEMIANEMYRAAVKAQAEVKKILDYLKKFDKKSTRERIGKAEGGFLDQIDALIARYNLHPQTKAVLAKKKAALREWYDAQVALGFEPTIDPDLMDESRRTNYKDVPLEDLQALQDAVKSIEYIASRIGKMKTIMGEKEYNDVVDLLVGKAEETLAKVPKPKEQILKSWLDRKKDMLKGHDVDLVSMETLIEILDGGAVGPWHDIVFNPASEAQSAEYDMAAEYGDVVGKIIDEYVEQDTSRILDMFQTDLQEEPMSRYKLLSIAFNIGNESNMEKMAKGHEWTEAQILEAVKKLDAKDLAFVQKIWDTLDTFYPKLNELQKKVSGVELARVQPRAVYLTLNDGSKVDLKGGYYPASYDPDFSMQGQKQDTGPLAGLTEQGYARATAPDSFRKTRTKFAAPMRLDFGYVLQKHLAGVMKDLSHREFLIDMNRLLRDKRIRKVIQERLGREYEQMFVPWLRGIANDRNVSPADMTGWDKRFEMARSHVTVVALGFKVTSILAQIAGLPNALEYVSDQYGSRYMATALNDFIRSPFDSLDMVRQKSGEMRHRFETIDREVRDELRRMQSAHPIRGLSKLMLAKEMFERAAFYGINFMDRVVAVPTWMAAYQGAKDQMIKDSPGMDSALMEKRAIHAGDAAVRRTQGAGGAKDLSAIQRKRGVMKILTMFYTPFAAWYGRLRTIGGRMARSNNRWRYTPEAIMHVALITMIPTIMAELLAGRGPEDCKNKEGGDYAACFGRWAAIKAGFSLAAPIPVIRDIANGLENYAMDGRPRDTRFSPVLDAINRVATTTRRAGSVMFGDKPLEDDLVFDIFETSGYFMGFPTAQPRVTLEYLYDLMTDEAKAETPLEFLSGLAYRRKPDRTR